MKKFFSVFNRHPDSKLFKNTFLSVVFLLVSIFSLLPVFQFDKKMEQIHADPPSWSTGITDTWMDSITGTYNASVTAGEPYELSPLTPVDVGVPEAGSMDNPYLIQSANDLAYLGYITNAGTIVAGNWFRISDNIDMNGHYWSPIGNDTNAFTGNIDGNGKTISNVLYYSETALTTTHFSMFYGTSNECSINNLTIDVKYQIEANATLSTSIGGFESNANGIIVDNCTTSGSIIVTNAGTYSVYLYGITRGSAYNCTNNATITYQGSGSCTVAGIADSADGCVNNGNISVISTSSEIKTNEVVGIGTKTVNNCVNNGDVSVTSTVGVNIVAGILIYSTDSLTHSSHNINYGDIIANTSSTTIASGVFAGCYEEVYNSINIGNILVAKLANMSVPGFGSDSIAGICASTDSNYSNTVKNCYNVGTVSVSGGNVTPCPIAQNDSAQVADSFYLDTSVTGYTPAESGEKSLTNAQMKDVDNFATNFNSTEFRKEFYFFDAPTALEGSPEYIEQAEKYNNGYPNLKKTYCDYLIDYLHSDVSIVGTTTMETDEVYLFEDETVTIQPKVSNYLDSSRGVWNLNGMAITFPNENVILNPTTMALTITANSTMFSQYYNNIVFEYTHPYADGVAPGSSWQDVGVVASSFDGGTGTQGDPYQIATASQLAYMASLINSDTVTNAAPVYHQKYFKLTADIDLAGKNWVPIGSGGSLYSYDSTYYYTSSFSGCFDGDGHIISNMTIISSLTNNGLFGHISNGAVVKNVYVVGVNIKALSYRGYIGTIFGQAYGDFEITNIVFDSRIYGLDSFSGGVGAYINETGQQSIVGCYGRALFENVYFYYSNAISRLSTSNAECQVENCFVETNNVGFAQNFTSIESCFWLRDGILYRNGDEESSPISFDSFLTTGDNPILVLGDKIGFVKYDTLPFYGYGETEALSMSYNSGWKIEGTTVSPTFEAYNPESKSVVCGATVIDASSVSGFEFNLSGDYVGWTKHVLTSENLATCDNTLEGELLEATLSDYTSKGVTHIITNGTTYLPVCYRAVVGTDYSLSGTMGLVDNKDGTLSLFTISNDYYIQSIAYNNGFPNYVYYSSTDESLFGGKVLGAKIANNKGGVLINGANEATKVVSNGETITIVPTNVDNDLNFIGWYRNGVKLVNDSTYSINSVTHALTFVASDTTVSATSYDSVFEALFLHGQTGQFWTDSGNYTTTWQGAGTSANPFKISTPQELAGLAYYYNSVPRMSEPTQYFELTSNIDLSGKIWVPIGKFYDGQSNNYVFSGDFDGKGFTISNMNIENQNSVINEGYNAFGLFGVVVGLEGTSISNLNITNSVIDVCLSSMTTVGIFVGTIAGGFTSQACNVENCSVMDASITVICAGEVLICGGVVGAGIVNNSSFSGSINVQIGSVETNSFIAGVGGVYFNVSEAVITNNHNYGSITVTGNKSSYSLVAGVLNLLYNEVVVKDSHNEGTIETAGMKTVGGVVCGVGSASVVHNCYNTGDITATYTGESLVETFVGGVVASNDYTGKISDCYNSGNITQLGGVGLCTCGVVAGQSSEYIMNCYNTGNINGSIYAVGIAVSDEISQCFNTGDLTGAYAVAIGIEAQDSYNTGAVTSYVNNGFAIAQTATRCYNTGVTTLPLTDDEPESITDCPINSSDYSNQTALEALNFDFDYVWGFYPAPVSAVGTPEYELENLKYNNGNATIASIFEDCKVVVSSTKCGIVTGGGLFSTGEIVTLEYTALDEGCQFSHWTFNGERIVPDGTTFSLTATNGLTFSATSARSGEYFVYAYKTIGEWTEVRDQQLLIGSGTESDPYLIETALDLIKLSDMISLLGIDTASKYFELTADIDLSGKLWTPIGNSNNTFKGYFNGNGHNINGMTISSSQYGGLFGYAQGATLKNITMTNSSMSIDTQAAFIGTLVGYGSGLSIDSISVFNTKITSSISLNTNSYIGGLVGRVEATSITNVKVYNSASNYLFDILFSHGSIYFGGVAGSFYGSGTISRAMVVANNRFSDSSTARSSYFGGITAYAYTNTNIFDCISSGTTTGIYYASGIVYKRYSSYSLYVKRCVSTITYNNCNNVAAISYADLSSSNYSDNYFLSRSSWYSSSYGTPLSSSDLKLQSSYANFDFSGIWIIDNSINNGYPSLRNTLSVDNIGDFPDPASTRWTSGLLSSGTGSSNDPFIISSANQLALLSGSSYLSGYYQLSADIDMSAHRWVPIVNFIGTFDGGGHIIKGLNFEYYITTDSTPEEKRFGFVGTNAGSIQNVIFEEVDFTVELELAVESTDTLYLGTVAGYSSNSILNTYIASGSINVETTKYLTYITNLFVGGVAGRASSIMSCGNSANITVITDYDTLTSSTGIGGIVGKASSNISNCFNNGNISGFGGVGGLVGTGSAPLVNVLNFGNVTSTMYAGGLGGYCSGGLFENAFNYGTVITSNDTKTYAGAFIGGVSAGSYTSTNSKYKTGCVVDGNTYAGTSATLAPETRETDLDALILTYKWSFFPAPTTETGRELKIATWKHNHGYPIIVEAMNLSYFDISSERNKVQLIGASTGYIENGTIITISPDQNTFEAGYSKGIWLKNNVEIVTNDVYTIDQSTHQLSFMVSLYTAGTYVYRSYRGVGLWTDEGNYTTSSLEGQGTQTNPYLITSGADLAKLAKSETEISGCYQLTTDIDLSAHQWTPISTFRGVFDGKGYKITGLSNYNSVSANTEYEYLGFIARFSGTFKNVLFEDLEIVYNEPEIVDELYAGLVAYTTETSVLVNCGTLSGNIIVTSSGNTYIGGILAYSSNTVEIKRCFNMADINYYEMVQPASDVFIGGILAHASYYLSISSCMNSGEIVGTSGCVAGIVCDIDLGSVTKDIRGCLSVGALNGTYCSQIVDSISSQIDAYSYFGNYYLSTLHSNQRNQVDQGNSLTSEQLKTQSNYDTSAFDFTTVWKFYSDPLLPQYNDGYPMLVYLFEEGLVLLEIDNMTTEFPFELYTTGSGVFDNGTVVTLTVPDTYEMPYLKWQKDGVDIIAGSIYSIDAETHALTFTMDVGLGGTYRCVFAPVEGYWSDYTEAYSGSGTEANPYIIDTPGKLANIGRFYLSSTTYYAITADLDMSAHFWSQIRVENIIIDGNNHVISGLMLYGNQKKTSMFYNANDRTRIKNIYLSDANMYITYSSSKLFDDSLSVAYGFMFSELNTGGSIILSNVFLLDCQIKKMTQSNLYGLVGGLVGYNYSIISNCAVINSESTPNLFSVDQAHYEYSNSMRYLTKSCGLFLGGICGQNDLQVLKSMTSFSYREYVLSYRGALAGLNTATISNCYNIGNLNTTTVCGFVGASIRGTISNCYNVGYSQYSAVISDYTYSPSFSNNYALEGISSNYNGMTSTSQANMKLQSTYSGWDFDSIWSIDNNGLINNGYPYIMSLERYTGTKGLVLTSSYNDSATITGAGQYETSDTVTLTPTMLGENTFQGWVFGDLLITESDDVYTLNQETGVLSFALSQATVGEYIVLPYGAKYFGWDEVAGTSFDGGEGTIASPYQIATAEQLAFLAKSVNAGEKYTGKYFVLTSNIDLSANYWVPIGVDDTNYFSGSIDGQGHVVSGYDQNMDGTYYYAGLFGYVSNSSYIKNITIANSVVNITVSNTSTKSIGVLVGYVDSSINISNITIKDCQITTPIAIYVANIYAAGIVGRVFGTSTISNCQVVNSSFELIKLIPSSSNTNYSYLAGIAGYANNIIIDQCSNNATIDGGYFIYSNYTRSSGILGYGNSYYTITNCYNTGSIIGSMNSYGIVYSGSSYYGTIKKCYSVGILYGSNPSFSITNSANIYSDNYYLSDLGSSSYGTSKTEAEMKTQSTYTNWDFSSLWAIESGENAFNNGYPYIFENSCEREDGWLVLVNTANDTYASVTGSGTYASGTVTLGVSYTNGASFGGWTHNGSPISFPNDTYTLDAETNALSFEIGSITAGRYMPLISGVMFGNWSEYTTIDFEGSGTQQDPYLIQSAGDLALLAKKVNAGESAYRSAYYKQTTDIDLNWHYWTPIGFNYSFYGYFDGQKHLISNMRLVITDPVSANSNCYYGLFGNGGSLSNIVLVDAIVDYALTANISMNLFYVGVISASASEVDKAWVVNSHITQSTEFYVTTGSYIGGALGYPTGTCQNISVLNDSESPNIIELTNISSTTYVGGVAGKGRVKQSNNKSNIVLPEGVGIGAGLVGFSNGSLYDSYNWGDITGGSASYGISSNDDYSIYRCYNIGEASDGFTNNGDVYVSYYINTLTSSYGEAKSDSELKNTGTYSSWDFDDIWAINRTENGGYPYIVLNEIFEGNNLKVLANVLEDKGSVVGVGAYAPGTMVTITPNISAGSTFVGWVRDRQTTGELLSSDDTYTIDVETGALSFVLTTATAGLYNVVPNGVAYDLWSNHVAENYAGGSGAYNDPYQIATAEQFAKFTVDYNSNRYSDFVLTDDIDLSSHHWVPHSTVFAGNLDGKMHTINGLTNIFASSNFALFNSITGRAEIKNIIFENVFAETSSTSAVIAHSLDDYYSGTTYFENIWLKSGSLSAASYIGGFISGELRGGPELQFINCGVTLDIGSISYAYGVGGFIGYFGSYSAGNTVSFSKCFINSNYYPDSNFGGFIGYTESDTLNQFNFVDCYVAGEMKTNTNSKAGFINGAQANCTITNSFTSSALAATSNAGRIKTPSQMKTQATYTGWDFDMTWFIDPEVNNGYPMLRSLNNEIYVYAFVEGQNGTVEGAGSTVFGSTVTLTPTLKTGWMEKYSGWTVNGEMIDFDAENTPFTLNETTKALSFILTSDTMLMFCLTFTAGEETTETDIASEFAGGIGTIEDPWQIATLGQYLRAIQIVNDNTQAVGSETLFNFILTADIDCEGKSIPSMGNTISYTVTVNPETETYSSSNHAGNYFAGVFNGNGHVIKNAYIATASVGTITGMSSEPTVLDVYGLFGISHNAIIKNLGIENIRIVGPVGEPEFYTLSAPFGGLAGNATIRNCYATGSSKNIMISAGLCGMCFESGTIEDCFTTIEGAMVSMVYSYDMAGVTTAKNVYSTGFVVEGSFIDVMSMQYGISATRFANIYSKYVSNNLEMNDLAKRIPSLDQTGFDGFDFVGTWAFYEMPEVSDPDYVVKMRNYNNGYPYLMVFAEDVVVSAKAQGNRGLVTGSGAYANNENITVSLTRIYRDGFVFGGWNKDGVSILDDSDVVWTSSTVDGKELKTYVSGDYTFVKNITDGTYSISFIANEDLSGEYIARLSLAEGSWHDDYDDNTIFSSTSPYVLKTDLFSGSGTISDPYQISSAQDLALLGFVYATMSRLDNEDAFATVEEKINILKNSGLYDAYFVLTNGISLGGKNWVPIGTKETPFVGTFNGQNYAISDLAFQRDTLNQNLGLFGNVDMSTLKNIYLKDANCYVEFVISPIRTYVVYGTLAANISSSIVKNIKVKANIGLSSNQGEMAIAGGLFGIVTDTDVDKVNIYYDIDATELDMPEGAYVGGIAAIATKSKFSNINTMGYLRGSADIVSTLVALAYHQIEMISCTNNVLVDLVYMGDETCTSFGSMIGMTEELRYASLTDCQNTASITVSNYASIGGLVGRTNFYGSVDFSTTTVIDFSSIFSIEGCENYGSINASSCQFVAGIIAGLGCSVYGGEGTAFELYMPGQFIIDKTVNYGDIVANERQDSAQSGAVAGIIAVVAEFSFYGTLYELMNELPAFSSFRTLTITDSSNRGDITATSYQHVGGNVAMGVGVSAKNISNYGNIVATLVVCEEFLSSMAGNFALASNGDVENIVNYGKVDNKAEMGSVECCVAGNIAIGLMSNRVNNLSNFGNVSGWTEYGAGNVSIAEEEIMYYNLYNAGKISTYVAVGNMASGTGAVNSVNVGAIASMYMSFGNFYSVYMATNALNCANVVAAYKVSANTDSEEYDAERHINLQYAKITLTCSENEAGQMVASDGVVMGTAKKFVFYYNGNYEVGYNLVPEGDGYIMEGTPYHMYPNGDGTYACLEVPEIVASTTKTGVGEEYVVEDAPTYNGSIVTLLPVEGQEGVFSFIVGCDDVNGTEITLEVAKSAENYASWAGFSSVWAIDEDGIIGGGLPYIAAHQLEQRFVFAGSMQDMSVEIQGSGCYEIGDTVNLVATVDPIWTWVGWQHDGEIVSNQMAYSFVLSDSNDGAYIAVVSMIEDRWEDVVDKSVVQQAIIASTADALFTGSGTEEDPFVISSAEELATFAYAERLGFGTTSFVKLGTSIDLSGKLWTPMTGVFMGTFDGNNNSIIGMTSRVFEIGSNSDINMMGGFAQGINILKNIRFIDATVIIETEHGLNYLMTREYVDYLSLGSNYDEDIAVRLVSSGNVYMGGVAGMLGTATNVGFEGNIRAEENVLSESISSIGSLSTATILSSIGLGQGAFEQVYNTAKIRLFENKQNSKNLTTFASATRNTMTAGVMSLGSTVTYAYNTGNITDDVSCCPVGVYSAGNASNVYNTGDVTINITSGGTVADGFFYHEPAPEEPAENVILTPNSDGQVLLDGKLYDIYASTMLTSSSSGFRYVLKKVADGYIMNYNIENSEYTDLSREGGASSVGFAKSTTNPDLYELNIDGSILTYDTYFYINDGSDEYIFITDNGDGTYSFTKQNPSTEKIISWNGNDSAWKIGETTVQLKIEAFVGKYKYGVVKTGSEYGVVAETEYPDGTMETIPEELSVTIVLKHAPNVYTLTESGDEILTTVHYYVSEDGGITYYEVFDKGNGTYSNSPIVKFVPGFDSSSVPTEFGTSVLETDLQGTTQVEGVTLFAQAIADGKFARDPSINNGYPILPILLDPKVEYATNDSSMGTVSATLSGNNFVSGSTVAVNDVIVLTASVQTGYSFKGWKKNGVFIVGETETTLNHTVVNEQALIQAVFEEVPPPTITIIGDGEVTVTRTGSTFTLEAIPGIGQQFVKYTINAVDNESGTLDSIQSTDVVIATFAIASYTIAIDSQLTTNAELSGGTVSADREANDDGTYDYGYITLTAVPDGSNRFVGWFENDELISSSAEYSFYLTKDREFVVKFVKCSSVTLTSIPTANISFIEAGQRSGDWFEVGTQLVIAARLENKYGVSAWLVDGIAVEGETAENLIYTVGESSVTITVETERSEPDFSVSPADGGVITVERGETSTLTLSLTDGYELQKWTIDGVDNAETGLVLSGVPNNSAVVAHVQAATYSVTLSCSSNTVGVSGGTAIVDKEVEDNGEYMFGTTALVATPTGNNTFAGWYQDGVLVSSNATYLYELYEDIIIEARFIVKSLVHFDYVEGSTAAQGTFTVMNGETEVTDNSIVDGGTLLTFTATRIAGNIFMGWYSQDNTLIDGNAIMTLTATNTINVFAKFAPSAIVTLSVAVGQEEFGSVSGDGEFAIGSSVRVSAIANRVDGTKYKVSGWKLAGSDDFIENARASYMFTLSENISLVAYFEVKLESSWREEIVEPVIPVGNVYEIESMQNLAWIMQQVNSGEETFLRKTIKLTANLTDNYAEEYLYWEPIGSAEHQFYGSFDGGNRTISGITLMTDESDELTYYGLFGYVSGPSIKNFKLENMSININSSNEVFVGMLAGIVSNTCVVENVGITGTTVISSSSDVHFGGISSHLYGKVKNSFVTASITLSGINVEAGGVVGVMDNGAKLSSTYSSGSISVMASGDDNYVGGIIALASGSYLYNTFTIMNVTAPVGANVGSIAGGLLSMLVVNSNYVSTPGTSFGITDMNYDNAMVKNKIWFRLVGSFTSANNWYGEPWNFDTDWTIIPGMNNNYPMLRNNIASLGTGEYGEVMFSANFDSGLTGKVKVIIRSNTKTYILWLEDGDSSTIRVEDSDIYTITLVTKDGQTATSSKQSFKIDSLNRVQLVDILVSPKTSSSGTSSTQIG